jgi:hypothetical protein
MKIHVTYKTTCTVTGRFYLGKHTATNLDDGYLGSGKVLKRSIEKYGKGCHVREILSTYGTAEEAYVAEAELITAEVIADPLCMNIKPGGRGCRGLSWTDEQRARLSLIMKGRPAWNKNISVPEHIKKKMSEGQVGKIKTPETRKKMGSWVRPQELRDKIGSKMKGRVFSAETIEKMKIAAKKREAAKKAAAQHPSSPS